MRRVHGCLGSLPGLLTTAALVVAGTACSNRDAADERASTALTVPLPPVTQFALLAARAVTVGDRGAVTGGHVGVAAGTAGALGALTSGFDAHVGVGEVLLAQSVTLRDRAATGELGATQIVVGANVTTGPRSAFVAPPAAPAPGAVNAGTTAINVNAGQTQALAPGRYGAVTVAGTLNLSGGLYEIQSLRLQPDARVTALAAATVRIATGLAAGDRSRLLPAAPLRAGSLRIMVGGTIDTNNDSVVLGTDGQLTAIVVARNAFRSGDRLIASGAIAAQDVILGNDDRLAFDVGFGCDSNASCNDNNPCTADACVDAVCTVSNAANGTACSDGNACTRTDSCQAGVCVGANPVTCTASDPCHAAGVCNAATGVCSTPPAANGTACNDGNACTRTDSCQAGACVGANSITCAASDQCHAVGVCNAATGVCSNPPAADGTACNDGNAGACVGGGSVACVASDPCHAVGVCNPVTGACSNPPAADGTACNDGNACTRTDSCQAGACVGAGPVACVASDSCHAVGLCDPATGACSNPIAANGTACNDGNACTQADSCQGGACVGGSPVICAPSGPCHGAGTCDPATGGCSNPVSADGTACSDGNACTQADRCQAGACVGGSAVTCAASDQCHGAGSCDPATGGCSNPASPDGTACDDGDLCTRDDACQAGACRGGGSMVTEYATGLAQPKEITLGPDGNLWFVSPETAPGAADGSVARLTPGTGAVAAFPAGKRLDDIAPASDGNLWLAEQLPEASFGLAALGRITTDGVFLSDLVGLPAELVTGGPDGNVWFASGRDGLNLVGSILTNVDLITNFLLVSNTPRWLTTGPDGNIWLTESNGGAAPAMIGRITPAGVLAEFEVSTPGELGGIIAGPDGNLWFTDAGRNEIGRITTDGLVITKFAVPTASSGVAGITLGSDGNLWFTERVSNRIGRITPAGQVTELACVPTAGSGPSNITSGPDGRLWFTESAAGYVATFHP